MPSEVQNRQQQLHALICALADKMKSTMYGSAEERDADKAQLEAYQKEMADIFIQCNSQCTGP